MKKTTIAVLALTCALIASAKDHKSRDYQMGVYQSSNVVADATTTNHIQCGDPAVFSNSTVCGGGIYENSVTIHTITVDDGTWKMETRREYDDAQMRTEFHRKSRN